MPHLTVEISNYRGIAPDKSVLVDLSDPITFILGLNNSGKSSILRFFSELRGVFILATSQAERPPQAKVSLNGSYHWDSLAHRRGHEKPMCITVCAGAGAWTFRLTHAKGPAHTTQFDVLIEWKGVSDPKLFVETMQRLQSTMYCGAARTTVFQGDSPIFNMQTGRNFVATWAQWAAGEEIRQRNAVEDLEEEVRRLFGFKRFSVKTNPSNQELIVTYDDGTFKLSELGEGLSHFIVVLANAMISSPSFILIDEPENGLHPKLQATFVQALASKAKDGVLASSHSVALARSVADRIMYCRKMATGVELAPFSSTELVNAKHELLEMSYSQFLETGVHNLLLVEGRTDIKAFREILKKYGIEQSFVILSLGGGEFVVSDRKRIEEELAGLHGLEPKSISVIYDSERGSAAADIAPKLHVLRDVCRDQHFNVFFTDRHSTENYVSQAAISFVLGPNIAALGPFESPGAQGKTWPKNKNWRLFSAMSVTDFQGTALHEFITKTLVPLATG